MNRLRGIRMTNKEMIDIAKEELIQMIARKHDDRCEAAKALAFLIMAENETKLPNIVVREVLD